MSQVQNVGDSDFDAEVLKSSTPVLVDFWAEWCGPCKMIAPILDEVAKLYAGRVKFVKVNVDEHTETPAKYAVRGIPSLLLFKNGDLSATKVGSLTKVQLAEFLDEHI
jgi:thioredoxin 1